MKIKISIIFLTFLITCSITKRNFNKLNTHHLRNIDSNINDYVIHLGILGYIKTKNESGNIYRGIINSLKSCQIINKRISLYIGFSKFLNNSSETLEILSDNVMTKNINRIDLHFKFDDEQNIKNYNSISKINSENLDSKKYETTLLNYNLYHYSISNPIINFEFIENYTYVAPRLEKDALEEYFDFGKLIGRELCVALKNI
ncbi:hypothetical protein EHR01_06545 [Leptospira mtsangambouensis]|uniref:Lipoprotein n=1 Tax=Leptospira mtsangambouensis TaxID=2484912 RepID=A0ABY2P4N3_9LEPT|nr:hypothetical protein [Leptospira mtsangambouensis]TGM82434.1 hypothetical protein EHR01_06545 [Leptospira mtsangambouensis]